MTDRTDADVCSLCDLPTPDPPITDDEVEGEYCCRGCLEVARALGGPDNAADADIESELGAGTDTSEVEPPDDAEQTYLSVDGMHCATCETFIESTAANDEGIYAAEASYATDMLSVTYDPEQTDVDDLGALLHRYGYDVDDPEATDEEERSGLATFLIGGGVFGMMVMVWYAVFLYPTYLGFQPLVDLGGFDGLYVLGNVWVMSSIVLFYTGYPLLRGAYVSLRAGQPNMDLLVALAAVSAYVFSMGMMLAGRTHVYFDVSVAIVLVVTVGNYYEDRIKQRAASRLTDLTSARVSDATRLTADGGTETVPVDELDAGDSVLVRPGERVPVDGVVVDGSAAIDESLVTGESLPDRRGPGDDVLGGTVVTDDPITVEVGEAATSTLDRLVELLWEIQSSRSGAQRLADKLATVFVPLVLTLAVLTTIGFVLTGTPLTQSILTGLTVLVVSCPCALGLATPLAVAAGVRDAAEAGVVVASDSVFEDAPDADVVVFDKTGTLTDGRMRVVDAYVHGDDTDGGGRVPPTAADGGEVRYASDETAARALALAAAVERYASHPIAQAVVDAGPDALPDVADPSTHPKGVTGTVDLPDGAASGDDTDESTTVVVGHSELLSEHGITIPDALFDAAETSRADGRVPTFVAWDGRARAVLDVGDAPRAEWESVVDDLGADREIVVLTGDDERAAERFRRHAAVDEVFAGVPPEAKAETVQRLRSRGTVAMVGDGSNDAPALASADVGIALGSGTDLAGSAADAVIVEEGLHAVPAVFDVASGTHRRIRENLGWAFVYNLVAVPLAIAGVLNPLLAAVAMGASSLLVVTNSSRSIADLNSGTVTDERSVPTSATDGRPAADTGPESGVTSSEPPTVE
ncbi:cation-translocating P-type ATPase [Halobellus sp. H-GB7]|uniref:heavy metal translocating P-type ATPase n=1 Tax=Halobellus sp. H-GB7 TaxID=3069756 RepID=UPI0027B274EA|nr:cation-translocating P-type ATPase [Halobellus sp. H-GB7]MDQ2053785.1 cation-translocating P-type ATPase [Halobellus sp. H-GB7]